MSLRVDPPVPGIDLPAQDISRRYFAVTCNTVRLGGFFGAGIAPPAAALTAFCPSTPSCSPPRSVDVKVGFEVEVFGVTFGGIRLHGSPGSGMARQ